MNPTDTNLDAMVRAAGARLKWSAVLAGSCRWFALCFGLWLFLFAADNLLALPAGLRLPLAVGAVAISAFELFRKVLRPAWRRQTPERTAVMLEQRYGIGENLLINALQFQRQSLRPEEKVFASQTIAMSGEMADRVHFGELWDGRALRVWGSSAAAVLMLWLAFVIVFPRQFGSAVERYALPLGDTPPSGGVVLKLTPDSDVTVPEGGSVNVTLEIRSPASKPTTKPPVIVWQERVDFIQPVQSAGENLAMTPAQNKFVHTFANLQTSFSFRVFAGDSFTRSIRVKVLPLPQLKDGQFRITPPAYTGLKPQLVNGPPAPVSALPGSGLEISFRTEPPVESASVNLAGKIIAFDRNGNGWKAATLVTNAGAYEISVRCRDSEEPVTLTRGDVQLLSDNPPEVDFVTDDRNRAVQFGQTLKVDVAARDDFGLAFISVVARPVEKEDTGKEVKRWSYIGPPGNPSPVREPLVLTIDPRDFESGATYYLEAQANDFRPGGTPSRSRPIVLRIKSTEDIALAEGDPLAAAFAQLKLVIAAQEKATRLTANVKTYLDDIIGKRTLTSQTKAISGEQNNAVNFGRQAVELFDARAEGKIFSAPLSSLVNADMAEVQKKLSGLAAATKKDLPGQIDEIESRQEQILSRLLSLLGQVADAQSPKLKPVAEGKKDNQPPVTPEDLKRELLDDMNKFVASQERIVEKASTLADKQPEDLTQEEKENLGEMGKEEAKLANFLEQKLDDISKLPAQDFADSSLAKDLNSVSQQTQAAAAALAQQKPPIAIPASKTALATAQEMVSNLGKVTLPSKPTPAQIAEEPPAPGDPTAAGEIPKELQDIMGDLLNQENALQPDTEAASSGNMTSLDKDPGGAVAQGPLSDMSAKGATGNQLPTQNAGGRAGEGRSGESSGQMVSDTAVGKGGKETPTRLTTEPFEQGSVKDTSKEETGGATGGGKLSGFAGEGLRGPPPPPGSPNEKMPRLAEQQAKIRQQAEALALQLRRYHISSGALETSVNAMNQLENNARKNDGLGVRRAFSQTVSALGEAKKTVDQQISVRREQDKLPAWMRAEIRTGVADGVPKGYEEMTSAYFRTLAETRAK